MQNNINIRNNDKNNRNKNINNTQINSMRTKQILIKENGIKTELSQEQLYEIFLLTVKYIDLELNTLPYKKATKIDKRNFCMNNKYKLIFNFLIIFIKK